jgi:hypothetical protein
MDETRTGPRSEARPYEIRLKGHLDSRWATRFDGMSLTHHSDGTTVLSGAVVDQAALHGLLQRLRDVGLPLISVTRLDQEQPPTAINPLRRSPEGEPS